MMSSRPSFLSSADDLRHEGQVACGERRNAHYMHVVLDSLFSGLLRGLEQRPHVDVETDVGITRGYYLGTAVVAVLAELRDHDTRLAALLLGELPAHSSLARSNCLSFFTSADYIHLKWNG